MNPSSIPIRTRVRHAVRDFLMIWMPELFVGGSAAALAVCAWSWLWVPSIGAVGRIGVLEARRQYREQLADREAAAAREAAAERYRSQPAELVLDADLVEAEHENEEQETAPEQYWTAERILDGAA